MWTKRFFFRITSLAWSPLGRRLAVGLARGISLQDAETGKTIATITSGEVRALAWSPDGRLLAAGGQDGSIQLWEAGSRTLVTTGRFHHHPVISVRWSPQGSALLSASSDGVHLWDTVGNTTLWRSQEPVSGYPVQVVWAPDGTRFAFADRRYAVQLRAASGDPLLATLSGDFPGSRDAADPVVNPIAALAWSPDGRQMAIQRLDGEIGIGDADTLLIQRRITGADGWSYLLEWSPDGSRLVGRLRSTTICLWNATSGEVERRYTGHRREIIALACHPDADRIASASVDHQLHVW